MGDAKSAISYLERALALRTTSKGKPSDFAHIQLTLAQALHASKQQLPRARALAIAARRFYVEQADTEKIAIADKLLAKLE